MWFCPLDGTLLMISPSQPGDINRNYHFKCSTCQYRCSMDGRSGKQRYTSTTQCARKQVDDILGGAAAWENVDRTKAVCPACHHDTAFFMQMQIRSADEPMSVFYKCVECSHQWNDK